MKNGKRFGKGILYIKKGSGFELEFYVEYNELGVEISKDRTFEGIRLMIIGNRLNFFFFFEKYLKCSFD